VELRRQITSAGHVLAAEYIDDGYTGMLLDRPALNRMRADLKTDRFDRIYFLAADRIARAVEYQRIIVGELLKHGKQITINGKDYEQNLENKLTLTMLGAFAKFERAKIIERTSRGRLHRLRMGEMSSSGHRIYGHHYVKKSPTAPATLVINEEQAAIVREIFEMFASGGYGLVNICRFLEEQGILTRGGKTRWDNDRIKTILKNETYTGTRYYNRMTAVTESNRESKEVVRGKWVIRDRSSGYRSKCPPSYRATSSSRCNRDCGSMTSDIARPLPTTSFPVSFNAGSVGAPVRRLDDTTRSSSPRARCPSIIGLFTAAIAKP
jgi:site-specific DNA recombinase